MRAEKLRISGIPSILWGEPSQRWIIAVHGNRSSKIDDCIWILAEEAAARGYQVLSFDLPCHGERVYEQGPCMVWTYLEELETIWQYAEQRAEEISLFGCSMGAYFGLLACRDKPVRHTWFLSPVVDMERMIDGIMEMTGTTAEELREKRVIENHVETLYWDYYCYVKEHPVQIWNSPTSILRGEHDTLVPYESVSAFAERFGCALEEQADGEHWFHTEGQLAYYRRWLRKEMEERP